MVSKLDLLNPQNYQSSSFWIIVGSLFGAVGVGTAIIGSFTNVSPQYILKSTIIMPTLVLLALDFVWILNKVQGTWVFWVIGTVMLPLIAGYAIALVEFWEGRD